MGRVVSGGCSKVTRTTTPPTTAAAPRRRPTQISGVNPSRSPTRLAGGSRSWGGELEVNRWVVSGLRVEDADIGLHNLGVLSGEGVSAANVGLFGVVVSEGGVADLRRVHVMGSAGEGVAIVPTVFDGGPVPDVMSSAEIDDLLVEDGVREGGFGRGLTVAEGQRVTLRRGRFERVYDVALMAVGGIADIEDFAAVDVGTSSADNLGGYGLLVNDGGTVTVRRALVEAARGVAIAAGQEGSRLEASDVRIVDTRGNDDNGLGGRGVSALWGAEVTLERIALEENREAGVEAAGEGTTLTAHDLTVAGTKRSDCETCISAGVGVVVAEDAVITLDGFRVADNAVVGLQAALGGEFELRRGEVVGHPIGLNVQTDGFDFNALVERGVRFLDNERTLDATLLPLPEPIALPGI